MSEEEDKVYDPTLDPDWKSLLRYHQLIDSGVLDENVKFEVYLETIDDLEKNKEKLGAAFPINPPMLAPLGSQFITGLSKLVETTASDSIDELLASGQNMLKQQAAALRQKVASATKGTPPIPPGEGITDIGDGGDGGTSSSNYAGGSNYNSTGLSLNLKPVNSNFNTDIVPTYRPKFFLDGRDSTSPLLIKAFNVWPEPSSVKWQTSGHVTNFIQTALVSAYVNSLNARVKPNSFTSTIPTVENITNYIRVISYALAVYYTYASIISHFRMERNRNEGMIRLYQQLSVQDLNQIGILGQLLNGMPIDPRLNEFMFHFYGNYKQSHAPGSPLMKNIAFPFVDALEGEARLSALPTVIPNIFEMFESQPFRNVQRAFSAAYPEILNSGVMHYSGEPNFDANWLTHWVNSPSYGASSQGNVATPAAVNEDTNVKFNMHTDAPDGWIEFASSIFDTTTNSWIGGIGSPKSLELVVDPTQSNVNYTQSTDMGTFYNKSLSTRGFTTAYIYRTDVDTNGTTYNAFWALSNREENQILSGNTYKVFDSQASYKSFQRFGTERAEPRTGRDSAVTTTEVIQWMYYPPSNATKSFTPRAMGSSGVLPAEDVTTAPKGKRRRRRK